MTAPFNAIEGALHQTLTTSAGTALWGTAVFADQAPRGTPAPYVVFSHVSGGYENITPTDSIDTDYQVECVSDDLAQAKQGAGYIEGALKDKTLTTSGWTNYATTHKDLFKGLNNHEGKQFYRRGGIYRIRLDG